jgi:hypothetical protein
LFLVDPVGNYKEILNGHNGKERRERMDVWECGRVIEKLLP